MSMETRSGHDDGHMLKRADTKQGEKTMRLLFAALGLFVMLGLVPSRAQDKTFDLKFSTWVPPQHPLNPALIAWGKDIEKDTNGTVKATLFPSEQLGKAFDHYDMVRDGIADFGYINPGYQPGRFPVIAA